MPAIEYLDDLDGFTAEVLDIDPAPEVRIQERGRAVKRTPDGPTIVEATIVLTHYERGTDVIRECVITVGSVLEEDKEKTEELRAELNQRIEVVEEDLKNRGMKCMKGRWTR